MGSAVEVSGGSCGNTMAGVASFGGKGAYIGKVRNDQLGHVFGHGLKATGVSFETAPRSRAGRRAMPDRRHAGRAAHHEHLSGRLRPPRPQPHDTARGLGAGHPMSKAIPRTRPRPRRRAAFARGARGGVVLVRAGELLAVDGGLQVRRAVGIALQGDASARVIVGSAASRSRSRRTAARRRRGPAASGSCGSRCRRGRGCRTPPRCGRTSRRRTSHCGDAVCQISLAKSRRFVRSLPGRARWRSSTGTTTPTPPSAATARLPDFWLPIR